MLVIQTCESDLKIVVCICTWYTEEESIIARRCSTDWISLLFYVSYSSMKHTLLTHY